MKKVMVKRLVYTNNRNFDRMGCHDYDSTLSDHNILCAIHEVGKTRWIGQNLWLLYRGRPLYQIKVVTVTQYQKRWYENVLDALRRI